MKETKVYVDKDLLSSFYTRSGTDLGKRKWVQAEIVFYNVNNIYLYDIKTHDQELVKEVCEKIREYLRTQVIYCGGQATELDIMIASAWNQVLEDVKQFLAQIQKEFEK